MDERRARILDDLRGLIRGDLHFEATARAVYKADAGPVQTDPLGVVAPRGDDDLAALMRYAGERALTLHPRGAGSGEGGGCTGPGLVVDLSRYFRGIELTGDRLTAQAGVVLEAANARLAALGRRLAVDPPYPEAATVGGAIACDALGPRSQAHGSFGDQVDTIGGIFASGDRGTLHGAFRPSEEESPPSYVEQVGRKLAALAAHHGERLARHVERRDGHAGYRLDALVAPAGVDVVRLAAGSAGSLLLMTCATLRTVPVSAALSVVVASFERQADAAEMVPMCVAARPVCCELFDGRSISLAREVDHVAREAVTEPPEAVLIVGFEGDDAELAADRARRLADRLSHAGRLTQEPTEFHRREDGERLIALRRLIDERLMRGRGPRRPTPIWDRLIVPVAALPSFLVRLRMQLQGATVAAVVDAHAGLGRVRVRPIIDRSDEADCARLAACGEAVRDLVYQLGGVASPGHGAQRRVWQRRFQGDLVHLHREIKYAFDPAGLLNPGAVAADEAINDPSAPRRVPSREQTLRVVETAQADTMVLRWPDRGRDEHLAACNDCGACRSQQPSLRMCPVFRATHAEAAAPRGKVNLLREIAVGNVDPRSWGSEEVRRNADLCVHCKLCEPECPAGVDVSSLMLEAKAAYVANHGLSPEDWMLSRIDVWSRWAARVPRAFTALMATRPSRWLLERALGLSRHRQLPLAPGGAFVRRAEKLGLTRPRPHEPGPRVAYFMDVFANYFDPELAEAVVAVLRHAGVNVYVPAGQEGCGMAALVTGEIDRARDLLLKNLRVLSNAVRDGYTIVCSEPTALLVLKREALRLTSDLDAVLVAANAMDVGQYLAGLLERGDVPAPKASIPVRVGYHQPCHLRALDAGTPGVDLMRRIPGLEVEFIDRGCSGMAGIYGLSARHFRSSLRAGRPLLKRLRDPDLMIGSSECSACRMQMEQGAGKRAIHPLKLLALAYGLNPAIRRHITEPKPRRRLSD